MCNDKEAMLTAVLLGKDTVPVVDPFGYTLMYLKLSLAVATSTFLSPSKSHMHKSYKPSLTAAPAGKLNCPSRLLRPKTGGPWKFNKNCCEEYPESPLMRFVTAIVLYVVP